MSGPPEERVALVTGGSRAKEIALRVAGAGGRSRPIAIDIADDDAAENDLTTLKNAYATIPLLVNDAGIVRDSLLLRMKKEEWDDVIGTNLTGIPIVQGAGSWMARSRYGRIANVTSVVGRTGNFGQSNYAAAKAGVEGTGLEKHHGELRGPGSHRYRHDPTSPGRRST